MPAALAAFTPLTLSSITKRSTRVGPHALGCKQKQIGRRLAAFHHLRGIEPFAEMRREAGKA